MITYQTENKGREHDRKKKKKEDEQEKKKKRRTNGCPKELVVVIPAAAVVVGVVRSSIQCGDTSFQESQTTFISHGILSRTKCEQTNHFPLVILKSWAPWKTLKQASRTLSPMRSMPTAFQISIMYSPTT